MHKIYEMPFARIYDALLLKVSRKNRTREELDEIIMWLTGYDKAMIKTQIEKNVSCKTFFDEMHALNSNAYLITGKICGIVIQEIEEDTMRYIRYLDKLVDELAKGKSIEKIKR